MDERSAHVVDFYDRHPISCAQILAALHAARGSLDRLRPEELLAYDQDHYGGLEANAALARAARLAPGMAVADFCAGLGGPARWYAERFGVSVTGVDLNASRVAGANELSRRVGLGDRVRVIEGDVTASGLPAAHFDAVLSQEAFLHLPDKAAALREAARVLKPGGRLALTDWTAHRSLTEEERAILWRGIAAQGVLRAVDYSRLTGGAGFEQIETTDLTALWGPVLEARLAMYRRLRAETRAAGLPSGDEAFYAAYASLVSLVQEGVLGGLRLSAVRSSPDGTTPR